MKLLANKIALVTGAANGIGRATAIELAKKGAIVIATDINEKDCNTTVSMITANGGTAEFMQLDVAKQDEVTAVIDAIVAKHGGLDLAVNNAGIGGVMAPLHDIKLEDWNRMMDINLTGQFFCMQAELKAMLASGGGSIVNIASLAGIQGVPYGGAYSVAKHGMVSLTKTAAIEYGTSNIRVNAVAPGFTETGILSPIPKQVLEFNKNYQIPMKRFGKPEEIAQSIAYLLGPEASYVNGTILYLEGGARA